MTCLKWRRIFVDRGSNFGAVLRAPTGPLCTDQCNGCSDLDPGKLGDGEAVDAPLCAYTGVTNDEVAYLDIEALVKQDGTPEGNAPSGAQLRAAQRRGDCGPWPGEGH